MLNKKLQIILITYNRVHFVKRIFEQFFYEGSPVSSYDFLVLDNNSTDDTSIAVKEIMKSHPNVRYIKNKYNIGLSGNIAKAMEIADGDYVWILGDDDFYDFSNWNEVESAMSAGEEAICVARYALPEEHKHDVAYQFLQVSFISGLITKTSLYTDTTMKVAFDNIFTLFPHLIPLVPIFNEGRELYVVEKAISSNGMEETTDKSYTRGFSQGGLCVRTSSMIWIAGYANVLGMIKDETVRSACFDVALKYIYPSAETFYRHMEYFHNKDHFMQFIDVYINTGKKHAKRLRIDYLASQRLNKCDIGDGSFTITNCVAYILRRILNSIIRIDKINGERYVFLFGSIKINL